MSVAEIARTTEADSRSAALADRIGPAIFAAACIVYAAVAFHVVRAPIRWLIGYTADDGYYYLQVARHIAAGQGATFDGFNPTNGYHPLWMLVCVCLAKLLHTPFAFVRAVLAAELFFNALIAVLLRRLYARFMSPGFAWLFAAAWLVSPVGWRLAMQLVEAPLYGCALVLMISAGSDCLRAAGDADERSVWPAVRLGAAMGAAFLCRTDSVLLSAATFAAIAIRAAATRGSIRRICVDTAVSGLVAAAFALPWLLISMHIVGTIVQDSGAMKMLWRASEMHRQSLDGRAWNALIFAVTEWIGKPVDIASASLVPAQYSVVACASAIAACSLATRGRDGWVLVLLGGATIAVGFAYSLLLADRQIWHFVVPAVLTTAMLAIAVGGWLSQRREAWLRTAAIAAILISCIGCSWRAAETTGGWYPWQVIVYDSQPRYVALMPAGARVGIFNAGIPAFYGGRRVTVVNIDGLANHSVVSYYRRHKFDSYLRVARITYLCDENRALERALRYAGSKVAITMVASCPLTQGVWRTLWRLDEPENTSSAQRIHSTPVHSVIKYK